MLLVVLALLAVLAAATGWMVRDALAARSELQSAAAGTALLRTQAEAGDDAAAATIVAGVQKDAAAARAHTSSWLWRGAGHLPWLGSQVGAVRTVAEVVDDLARTALPPLVDAVGVVKPSSLAPVGGRVNLAPLRAVAPQVIAADESMRTAEQRLADAAARPGLLPQVADQLAALRAQLRPVAGTVATAARAVQLLPAMLGADGPRDYLVLVQNNAELRATGGIPGSVLLLHAEGGRVQFVETKRGGDLVVPQPVDALTPAEAELFGPLLATDMRDVTFTPDFVRTGQLAAGIWKQATGHGVDGVLSVDPGTVALVLRATGPVALADGTKLTADNAVAVLLNEVYFRLAKPADQDAFFAATAGTVFGAVLGGQGKPAAVMESLAEATRQGRLMLWSAHPDEQAQLAGTVLSGALRGPAGASPVIGVYLNDGTQSKLDYYLDLHVGAQAVCEAGVATGQSHVTVTLTSRVPADTSTLPQYVTGAGVVVPRGIIRTNVLIYAPDGGQIESVRVNSQESGVFSQQHEGLAVAAHTFDLKPGETGTLDLTISAGPGAGDPRLRVTPTARTSTMGTGVSSCTG